MSYVVQRAFRDTKNMVTTQLFFVNSFRVFRVAPLVDQLKRQVDQSIQSFNVFQIDLFIKIETDVESHVIISFFFRLAS